MSDAEEEGGRIFFARARRAPDRDADIRLISVGVDIGSATAHLAFSRLVLRRRGNSARLMRRELLHESGVLLTPFTDDETIDTDALGAFIATEYAGAEIDPDSIDTGALILTGLAARRRNARAIGELFAAETGRFVAVAAGDGLETILAAHGAGAVAASAHEGVAVMNLDIGGGTSKIARCVRGEVASMTALDIGARLVLFDEAGRVTRIEPAGAALLAAIDLRWQLGDTPREAEIARLAETMAQCLFEACGGAPLSALTRSLLRLPELPPAPSPGQLSFSGGVAEYVHGREARGFGDLGRALAGAVRTRLRGFAPWRIADHGLRATVIGASQFSVRLSGNTIFVDPPEALPLASLPAIRPEIDYATLNAAQVADAVRAALRRLSLEHDDAPVALAYDFQGDATHARLAAFCAGSAEGLAGRPLVLVGSGDFGGLIGAELRRSGHAGPIVSIDGIVLRELDFIDIGALLQVSGGVPVVVKSLVFATPPRD